MKHLKVFEDYSKEDIKKFLLKAQKNSDLDIKTDIDQLLTKLRYRPDIGTFEDLVENEANFISEYNYQKMGEYISRFDELGLDVTRLEELYPSLFRYKQIQLKELENYEHGSYSKKQKEYHLDRLENEMDELTPDVKELEKEVRRLAKEAKKLI